MIAPPRTSAPFRPLHALAGTLAVVIAWALVVAIRTACFFPPGATFPPDPDDWEALVRALVFGSSTALACGFAIPTALAVGGRPRWALSFLVAIALSVAFLAATIVTCLWLAPWIARGQMGYWEFERLRQTTGHWAASISLYEAPLAAAVGPLLGSVSGLLVVLSRRRPRAALGLLLGLLVAGAFAPFRGPPSASSPSGANSCVGSSGARA
jgi:hypothetical protein